MMLFYQPAPSPLLTLCPPNAGEGHEKAPQPRYKAPSCVSILPFTGYYHDDGFSHPQLLCDDASSTKRPRLLTRL